MTGTIIPQNNSIDAPRHPFLMGDVFPAGGVAWAA